MNFVMVMLRQSQLLRALLEICLVEWSSKSEELNDKDASLFLILSKKKIQECPIAVDKRIDCETAIRNNSSWGPMSGVHDIFIGSYCLTFTFPYHHNNELCG